MPHFLVSAILYTINVIYDINKMLILWLGEIIGSYERSHKIRRYIVQRC